MNHTIHFTVDDPTARLTPEECERLLLELEGIIKTKARKLYLGYNEVRYASAIDADDIAQMLRIKTWSILKTYDGSKSAVTTYVNTCLNRTILNMRRDFSHKKWHHIQFSDTYFIDDELGGDEAVSHIPESDLLKCFDQETLNRLVAFEERV